jgi:Kdo2-lipid IVA lauroyltransferase/acyltransferase
MWLLRQFARLPLVLIHLIGSLVGWGIYFSSRKTAARMRNNLHASGLCPEPAVFRKVLQRNIAETGKGLVETFAIWFRPHAQTLQWVRECRGWEHVEKALADGGGIIFLTPHLGCFEITSLYYAAYHPISVLYRPPRKAWLEPLIHSGRARGQVTLAPTNLKGVRSLLQALKRGEAIGILPDQVPSAGEGEWADFFGRPAYTMTLVNRLAQSTGATVLMAFGERLAGGKGYIIHIEPLPTLADPAQLNRAIENLVQHCPEQYLWSYARFKTPRGAPKPPV